MLKRYILIWFMAVTLFACEKGRPVEEYYFASFRAELIALPETPDMLVFVGDKEVDSLKSTGAFTEKHMLPAGKEAHVYFKNKTTGDVLLDTLLSPLEGQSFNFKLAWSEVLGLKEFIKGGGGAVHADTVEVRVYNKLPVEIMPEGVTLDAYLYVSGQYDTPLKVFPEFERNKMHPLGVSLRYKDDNGTPISYDLKFKNVTTGDFLVAGGRDYTQFSFLENGRYAVTVMHQVSRGRYSYLTEAMRLPY